jgi:hypothetical protein
MIEPSFQEMLLQLLQTQQPQSQPQDFYQRNQAYALPPSMGSYLTKLPTQEELAFQQWVQQNQVPFNPAPNADYDMRGFWQALMANDPRATTAINPNDKQMHYPDYWKTPYHESFSAESKWAAPGAPVWNNLDQLVLPSAKIAFDEKAKNKK